MGSTPLLPPSRPSEPSSSSTGAQPVSRSVSTTNHPPPSQAVTWPRSNELSACCPTPLLSPKLGLDLTTSSILCMPSELSSTGMSVKVWKKVSSLKPEKIWLLWRRIMRKLVLTLLNKKVRRKVMNTKLIFIFPILNLFFLKLLLKKMFLYEKKIKKNHYF